MSTTLSITDTGIHEHAGDGETHADDCRFCAEFLEPVLAECRAAEARKAALREDAMRQGELGRRSGCFDD